MKGEAVTGLQANALQRGGRPAWTSTSLSVLATIAPAMFHRGGRFAVRTRRAVYNRAKCVGTTGGLVQLEYTTRKLNKRTQRETQEVLVDQVAVCDILEARELL